MGQPTTKNQKIPRGDKSDEFPTTKDELLKFDLIIFGEISPEEFTIDEQNWIVDFVTQRVGEFYF